MAKAVILIPGIKGTKLLEINKTPHDTLWSEMQYRFESIEDLELTTPDANGIYYDKKLESIIGAGEIEELGYSEFIHDVDAGGPIYIFGYDWRLPAEQCAMRLHAFLEYLKGKSKVLGNNISQFDFVTHSMGSHVLSAYLQEKGMNDVGRIVFVAPPFLGSLDIASGVVLGEGWFEKVKAKFRKLIRTFPGSLQLLPRYENAGLHRANNEDCDFFDTEQWQSNILKSSLFKETLATANNTVSAKLFDLASLSPEERKKVLVIARTQFETSQSMYINATGPDDCKNYFDFKNMCKTTNGDGRVPDKSSCHYHNVVDTLMIDDANFYREHSHATLMKDERVQGLCSNFLKNGKVYYNKLNDSVQKVTGLKKKLKKGLPYWEALY